MANKNKLCEELLTWRLWNCAAAHGECDKCQVQAECEFLYQEATEGELDEVKAERYLAKFQS